MSHDRGEAGISRSVLFVLVVLQALWREEKFGAKALRRHEWLPDPSLNHDSLHSLIFVLTLI